MNPLKRFMVSAILGVESHAVLQKLETGVVFSMKNCQKSWQFFPPDCICVKEEDDKDACDVGFPIIRSKYILDSG